MSPPRRRRLGCFQQGLPKRWLDATHRLIDTVVEKPCAGIVWSRCVIMGDLDYIAAVLFGVGGHLHFDDLIRVRWRLTLCDSIDMLHALADRAPDRVLTVQELGIAQADEKLTVSAVRVLGASHADSATHERRT